MKKPLSTEEELNIIDHMVTQASRYSLLTEVVWSFSQFRAHGDDVVTAAAHALYEWDI